MGMKVNRKEDYAVVLMTVLAKENTKGFVSLQELGKKYKLPLPFLRQIARDLKRKKLIESKEGKNGGYRLLRRSSQISIHEIMEAVAGTMHLTRCTADITPCPLEPICPSRDPFKSVHGLVLNIFKKTSLAQFMSR
jgi:Rrf2 family protein